MSRHFIIICLLIFAYGCCHLLPADGAFKVIGTVSQSRACELRLLSTNDEVLQKRELHAGSFEQTFIVSGCPEKYKLQAVCDGKITKEALIEYGKEATYKKPHDIGIITMKPHWETQGSLCNKC